VSIERDRLQGSDAGAVAAWREWGPFVSEREWGTVREDYSADGEAWRSSTHDDARSLAYRWGEDGLAAICDRHQHVCLGLALWNGRDPILKERLFGLGGKEGNHGEDVKECYWYVDATPTHSWLRWRYHYPQQAFPYGELVAENARRGYDEAEYELIDTGTFERGFWAVDVDWAKAAPDDLCLRITAVNHGPETATLHVLPTVWMRNTWDWVPGRERPELRGHAHQDGHAIVVDDPALGRWIATSSAGVDGDGEVLFCENETNTARLYGTAATTAFPKDGINDHVVDGADTVNPAGTGTKAAWWFRREAEPGAMIELRVRFTRVGDEPAGGDGAPAGDAALDRTAIDPGLRPDLGRGFERVHEERRAEADAFYAELAPAVPPAEALVMRQAFAGVLWSQQFYRYSVARWLDGDPTQPAPPPGRGDIRNGHWRHLDANDVILMPDKWEYPWFASWDLAFHCVVLAHIDPELAKEQLLLLLRVWYQHPNGQIPAYEWSFDDANPPVHAWAAMRVFEIDGSTDVAFLERVFAKLLINFTWWVNREDADGNNAFEGGFLGLDNIGPFNRSARLPVDGRLEQSDGTAWMAMYCLDMLHIAVTLAERNHVYEDLAVKFFEHFVLIAQAMGGTGFWSEEDGFYYDIVRLDSGEVVPVRVRSMVGVVPLVALAVADGTATAQLPEFRERVLWFLAHTEDPEQFGRTSDDAEHRRLVSLVTPERLVRILGSLLDEERFLSPHGLRSLSRYHLEHPVTVDLGGVSAVVDYEPGESTSGLFGGNSNWRGPVWYPLNFLVVVALRRFHDFLGDRITVELPTGSGRSADLGSVADELARRLVATFLPSAARDGGRPVFGTDARFRDDPAWQDLIWFFEYFHGDDGRGLGASHQTGWTALVADLILSLHPDPAGGS